MPTAGHPKIAPFWTVSLILSLFLHPHGRAELIEPDPTTSARQAGGTETLEGLRSRLSAHVTNARFAAAEWGIKVASVDTGKTIFEFNPQKLLSPASNSKLYTVALALDRLGTNYQIKTSLYAPERPNNSGEVTGDLVLYGRGDPCITARLHSNNIFVALAPLVSALTNAGVKRIRGDLVGDEGFFRGHPYGSGWAWDDAEAYYGAEISALTINDNTVKLKVSSPTTAEGACELSVEPASRSIALSNQVQIGVKGEKQNIDFFRPLEQNLVYVSGRMPRGSPPYSDDVPVHQPALFFVEWLREAMSRAGIAVEGKSRTRDWREQARQPVNYAQQVELGSAQSLPMAVIAREVMKPSQNLYTDLLLAQVGEKSRTTADPMSMTSERLGIRELNRFLLEAGVKAHDVLFEEGSGLSRNNLTTARATVQLLLHMSHHKGAAAYYEALPIAGVDGTLRNRMKNTPAAGNVRAKTGTLRWANSLSGYLTTAGGEKLAFSIMLNRYQNPDDRRSAREELDAIAVMLASFTGHD
jgi:D-alanyl-D-alanine carboxypeptidase/D-alanyl-D-alanine-endopeptidase (penicillin-binding protein 4)